jgi:5-formyltetrahydrofolate cyclo-ligase
LRQRQIFEVNGNMEDRQDIMHWRKEERQRQIDARMALSPEIRQSLSTQITVRLQGYCTNRHLLTPGTVISAWWPLRGEPDLRPWMHQLHDAGLRCALPVVIEKGQALGFRAWSPGCHMTRGFWNIPVPADETPLQPQVLLAPVVGFDPDCYRLGYGGGYFDRTLATLSGERHVIGVGYAMALLPSIRPLLHDLPMQAVVTESAVFMPPAT